MASSRGSSLLRPGTGSPRGPMHVDIGDSGLRRSGGHVHEEFRRELVGRRGAEAYREMASNSSVLGAALLAIELPCRRADWYLEPADTPAGQEVADFVEECREDLATPWGDVLQEILTMVIYGWALLETTYKTRQGPKAANPSRFDDGRVGWRAMSLRAQDSLDRWEIDETGGILGMWQRIPHNGKTVGIPIERAQLFRTSKVRNNPEGRSLLRTAYFAWYHAKRMMTNEGIGVERDLTGVPSAGVPPEMLLSTASPADKASLESIKTALRDLKMDEQGFIVYPLAYDQNGNPKFTMTLLASPGRRTHDTTAIINRYELRMAQALMAGFLMLGHSAVGSRALADPLIEFFMDSIAALLDTIADTFNRHAIPALLAVNGIDPDDAPLLAHGPAKTQDLAALGQFIKTLSEAGMPLFPNEELERHLLDAADLPEPAPGAKSLVDRELEQAERESEREDDDDPNADPDAPPKKPGDDDDDDDDPDDDDVPRNPEGKKPKPATRSTQKASLEKALAHVRMMARRRRPPRGAKLVLRELERASGR